jgi:hypothetical protein
MLLLRIFAAILLGFHLLNEGMKIKDSTKTNGAFVFQTDG